MSASPSSTTMIGIYSTSRIPQTSAYVQSPEGWLPYPKSPEEAQQMLSEAGVGDDDMRSEEFYGY